MDVVAESVIDVCERRSSVRGLTFSDEPEHLRFFQARFAPVGGASIFATTRGEATDRAIVAK
jgi:tyrosine phenol-lyase